MTGKTHILGGVATSVLLMAVGHDLSAVSASAAVFGSLLPDIDHFNSKISNKNFATKMISAVTTTIFKHRGFLHTPLFILLTGAVLFVFGQYYCEWLNLLILPICAGMLSHLCLDTLNPQGIMWAYPFSRRRMNLLNITTSSFMEDSVVILLFGIIFMGLFRQAAPFLTEFLLGL